MAWSAAIDTIVDNQHLVPVQVSYKLYVRNGYQFAENENWTFVPIVKNSWTTEAIDGNPVISNMRCDILFSDFGPFEEFDHTEVIQKFSQVKFVCEVTTPLGIEQEVIWRGYIKTKAISNLTIKLHMVDLMERGKYSLVATELVGDLTAEYTDVALDQAANWDDPGTLFTFEIDRVPANTFAFFFDDINKGRRIWQGTSYTIEADDGGGFVEIAASEYEIDCAMGLVRFHDDQNIARPGWAFRLTSIQCFKEGTLEFEDVLEYMLTLPSDCGTLGVGALASVMQIDISGTMNFVNGSMQIAGVLGTDFHTELSEGDRVSCGDLRADGIPYYGIVASVGPGEVINLRYPYNGPSNPAIIAYKSTLRESRINLTNVIWDRCKGTFSSLYQELVKKYAVTQNYKLYFDHMNNHIIGDRIRLDIPNAIEVNEKKVGLNVNSTTEDFASAVVTTGIIGRAKNLAAAASTNVLPVGEVDASGNAPWAIGFGNPSGTQPYLEMTWLNAPDGWLIPAGGGTITFNAGGPPYTVTGIGTAFLTDVQIGDYIALSSDLLNWGVVDTIINDTSLTLMYPYTGATPAGPVAYRIAGARPIDAVRDTDTETTYAVMMDLPGTTEYANEYHDFLLFDLGSDFDLSSIILYNAACRNENQFTFGVSIYGGDSSTGPWLPLNPETIKYEMDPNERKEFDISGGKAYRWILIKGLPYKWTVADGAHWPRYMALREVQIFGSQTVCVEVCSQSEIAPGAYIDPPSGGTIQFDAGGPPYTITGIGTQFTVDLAVENYIALASDLDHWAVVKNIIDDTHAEIYYPFNGSTGVFDNWKISDGLGPYVEGEGGHFLGGSGEIEDFIIDYKPHQLKKMAAFGGHQTRLDEQGGVMSEMMALDRGYLTYDELQRDFREVSVDVVFDPRLELFKTVKVIDEYRKSGSEILYYEIQRLTRSETKVIAHGTELGAGPLK